MTYLPIRPPVRTFSSNRSARRAAGSPRRALAEPLENRLLLATQTFGNGLSVSVFDDFNPPTPANRYPLPATVTGVVEPVTELRITLHYFYHERPEDIDVLVMAPSGKTVMLMSDAGSVFPVPPETGADLTFADSATRDLPELAQITAGVYRPTNYDNDDFFPFEPPPDAPSHESLADLVAPGDDVNGTWRLYVVDDSIGGNGGFDGGWTLTFVTGTGPVAPSTPDLISAHDRGPSNSDNVTNMSQPQFRGTAAEGTQVRLFIDGVANATGTVTNGNYTVTAQFIPDGTHAISVRAIDAEGNEGAVSGDLMVTIDTDVPPNPTVPDLAPESDTGASNSDNDTTDTTPTFTGTAGGGAARIILLANDLPVGTADVVGGAYTATVATPLAPGTYLFSAIATDLAGNNSAAAHPALSVVIREGTTTFPQVTDVWVRGTQWLQAANASFMQYIGGNGSGDAVMGFKASGLPATATLPWINMNQVVLRYASPLPASPEPGPVTLDGVRSDYTLVSRAPLDERTFVWNLDRALGNQPGGGNDGDRVLLTVPGAGPGGGNYQLTLNVLQGDADRTGGRVTALDLSTVKARANRTATDGPGTGAVYTAFADIDANGRVNALDLSGVKARLNDALPAAASVAAAASPTPFGNRRIAEDVLA